MNKILRRLQRGGSRRRTYETKPRTRAERPRIGNITVREFIRVFIQPYLYIYEYTHTHSQSTCRHYCSSVFGLLLLFSERQWHGRVQTINRFIDRSAVGECVRCDNNNNHQYSDGIHDYDKYYTVSYEIYRNLRSRTNNLVATTHKAVQTTGRIEIEMKMCSDC